MTRLQSALALAFSGGIPRRAFIVALTVGSVLNLINQGDALIAGRTLDWLKIALTYIVPYCVNTHGAVTARLGSRARPSQP
jgi:hypothetical protein